MHICDVPVAVAVVVAKAPYLFDDESGIRGKNLSSLLQESNLRSSDY